MNLFLVAVLFFIIGSLTLGGGLVSIALIDQYIVQGGFLTRSLFEVMIAIAESTPGPIAINLATFIGFNEASWFGATFVTFSFILPSILAVWWVALPLLHNAHRNIIKLLMKYLTWSVGAIIFYAVFTLIRSSRFFSQTWNLNTLYSTLFIALMVGLAYRFPKHPLWLIAGGAMVGFLFF